MTEQRTSLSAFLPSLSLLAFSLLWTGAMVLWPEDGQTVAAIFPPSRSGEAALADAVAAGAEAVEGFGAWDTVVVARSADRDFVSRLYRHGALVVVKAAPVGCVSL